MHILLFAYGALTQTILSIHPCWSGRLQKAKSLLDLDTTGIAASATESKGRPQVSAQIEEEAGIDRRFYEVRA